MPDTPFNFEEAKVTAEREYQKKRKIYEDFADVLNKILTDCIESAVIKVASIQTRAKSVNRFGKKASRRSKENPDEPKYTDPLNQITDLTGARIITFVPKTITDINKIIYDEFKVLEKEDKSKELFEEEKFGYQSIHYLVKLNSNRAVLPEYKKYKDLIAEIQVRTILQHAWAEFEHGIQYELPESIPVHIKRRFMSLAGLFEIADRELQAIQDEDQNNTKEARVAVEENKLAGVEITADALKMYLDKKLGSDERISSFSYEWTVGNLKKLGFSNFQEIDKCISDYDDNEISKIIEGKRSGQLSRFDYLLLAGMGINFVNNHPWKKLDWFIKREKESIEKLQSAGIKIKNYSPIIK
jgi:putative GTP pyrophosphokinase